MGRTKTIEVTAPEIDLTDLENSYNPNSILEDIAWKYGGGGDYTLTYIQLSRFDNIDRAWKTLRSDFTALPSEDDIRLQYGGGKYRLLINFKIAGDNKRRLAPPQYFIFEGDPIPVQYNPEKTNGTAPMEVTSIEDRIINRLKTELPNLNGNQQKDNSMQFVIEEMRSNKELMLKLIENMSKNNNPVSLPVSNGIDEKLLSKFIDKAFERNEGELDKFLKNFEIVEKLKGKTDGGFDWASLVNSPLGQTVAMKLIEGGKQPAVAGLPGPGAANPMDAINQILQGVQSLQLAVTDINKRLIEVEKIAYEDEPADEIDTGDVLNIHNMENQTNGNLQTKEKDDMFGMDFQNELGEQLRKADVPTKIATLLDFVKKGMDIRQMFEWCVKYKALEAAIIEPYNEADALQEFNGYMKQAGLTEIAYP